LPAALFPPSIGTLSRESAAQWSESSCNFSIVFSTRSLVKQGIPFTGSAPTVRPVGNLPKCDFAGSSRHGELQDHGGAVTGEPAFWGLQLAPFAERLRLSGRGQLVKRLPQGEASWPIFEHTQGGSVRSPGQLRAAYWPPLL